MFKEYFVTDGTYLKNACPSSIALSQLRMYSAAHVLICACAQLRIKQGDIAIWQQGKFPARWYGQGMYLMPGIDSSYQWQGFIPQSENPHAHLDSGFLESANQRPVDSTYPYFIPGNYITPRGISIARNLSKMEGITVDDMKALQNNYYSVFAEGARAMLLKYVKEDALDGDEKNYLEMVRNWDLNTTPNSTATTVYQTW
ncbi:MAG TPA: penicillin acylase family protein, partial [Flavisolibacter sp.]|nr:penicillin acylase family protein [Flavisolibacter sp.]